MPFLSIDSTVASNPSRADLSIIGGWMMWPNDEGKRLDFFTSEVVARGLDLKRQGQLDHSVLGEVLELAATAKPVGQMFETEAYKHGLMAGSILIAAIEGKDKNGDRLTRSDIDKRIAKRFARRRGDNSKFVNDVWKDFRCVSHLWAAHIKYTEVERERTVFPCALDDVITFLWLSEKWRKEGERTKTRKNSPSTILNIGECVRVPDGMEFSK